MSKHAGSPCIVNGQIAATLSHKRAKTQSAARNASAVNIELLSLAISVWFISQQESSISVGECSHGRCGQFSSRFFSFLRHEPSPVVAPSLHAHERLRQHQEITRRDTSQAETIAEKSLYMTLAPSQLYYRENNKFYYAEEEKERACVLFVCICTSEWTLVALIINDRPLDLKIGFPPVKI